MNDEILSPNWVRRVDLQGIEDGDSLFVICHSGFFSHSSLDIYSESRPQSGAVQQVPSAYRRAALASRNMKAASPQSAVFRTRPKPKQTWAAFTGEESGEPICCQ